MSLIPKNLLENDLTFTPFFRFLDDFNTYSGTNREAGDTLQTFTPKFDIHENKESFSLYGELPGVDQKHVDIEFIDPQTLKISGRIERSYESPKEGEKGEGGAKVWRSERNFGQFSRSFGFPQPVDQDSVKASLKDGILNLTIPKTKKEKATKKIAIN